MAITTRATTTIKIREEEEEDEQTKKRKTYLNICLYSMYGTYVYLYL